MTKSLKEVGHPGTKFEGEAGARGKLKKKSNTRKKAKGASALLEREGGIQGTSSGRVWTTRARKEVKGKEMNETKN